MDLEDLEPGDALWAAGVRSEVVERRVVHGDVEVFNVEVDGLHNYVVVADAGDVLVHNGVRCSSLSPQARRRASEARVLDDLGLTKNTDKVTGREGRSIPDAITPGEVVEIKDAQRVSNTKQLRIQREYAETSGREHVVIVGGNTRVSSTVTDQSTVIRRPDLGPR